MLNVAEMYWTLCKADCNLATVAMDDALKDLKKPWRNSGRGLPQIFQVSCVFTALHGSSCLRMSPTLPCLKGNVGTSGWASVGPGQATQASGPARKVLSAPSCVQSWFAGRVEEEMNILDHLSRDATNMSLMLTKMWITLLESDGDPLEGCCILL